MTNPIVRLKPKEDIRLLSGHPWVFSNEISNVDGQPANGDIVEIRSAKNHTLGFGFYNANTLITVRILSKGFVEPQKEFFAERISTALSLREKLFNSRFYRLAYGESDFLPGLIIDRFGELFSVQILSAGMERRKDFIYDSIRELFSPAAIYERNDTLTRELEGLPQSKSVIFGAERTVDYDEDGVVFRIDPFHGQKTGFYFDQRMNRIFSRRFGENARVLDLYSNEGGFALNMAHAGAREVVAVDSSQLTGSKVSENARLNKFEQIRIESSDAMECLDRLSVDNERFDVIVCDPPNFARSKKNVASAKAGYRLLHKTIFGLLKQSGILLTSSCSHHIFRTTFEDVISDAALKSGRALQLLQRSGASPDHPLLPSMPETEYLKFNAYRVI